MMALPSRRLVSAISGLVSEYCRSVLDDPDLESRFDEVAEELAESLLKYSCGSEANISAVLSTRRGSTKLHLEATNRATTEQLRAVDGLLRALTEASEPTRQRYNPTRAPAPRGAGQELELARLQVEGGMNVRYTIEGDLLTISVDSCD